MEKFSKKVKGFTLMELLITIVIVGILAAIAIPSYLNYTRKAYYSEIVRATAPFKIGVGECYHDTGDLIDCAGGDHGVPADVTAPQGGVASITTSATGVITVVPVADHGITAADTYVLTPAITGTTLTWTSSGGGVTAGYAR